MTASAKELNNGMFVGIILHGVKPYATCGTLYRTEAEAIAAAEQKIQEFQMADVA